MRAHRKAADLEEAGGLSVRHVEKTYSALLTSLILGSASLVRPR
jgi:hypothetical protein